MAFDPEIPVSQSVPPPEGMWAGVLVDLVYMKFKYGEKPERTVVKPVFELECINEDSGEPFFASQMYSFTMSKKGKLSKMLEGWKGRPFSDDERKAFRLSTLQRMIGQPCRVMIVHTEKDDGSIWGGIAKVSLANPGQTFTPSGKYKRSDKDIESERAAIAADQAMQTPEVMG